MLTTLLTNVLLAPLWVPAYLGIAIARSFMSDDDFSDVFGPDAVEDVLA